MTVYSACLIKNTYAEENYFMTKEKKFSKDFEIQYNFMDVRLKFMLRYSNIKPFKMSRVTRLDL